MTARAVSAPRTCATIVEMRATRRALPSPVGIVPTMGALHEGHTAIVRRAREECASVVVTIFVNPLQFGRGEDFERYPRAFENDVALLEALGADAIFAPSTAEMYPRPVETAIDPGPLARYFEGERRPGHFRGVTTVVAKLFNIVAPDRAYFGSKDAQQLAIVRRMTDDLNLGAAIVACPTVRESDGLAMSSRNAYLQPTERDAAPHLYQALRFIARRVSNNGNDDDLARTIAEATALLAPLKPDYLAVVDPQRFEPLAAVPAGCELLAIGAAYAGATRLIDNVEIGADESDEV